MLPFIPFYILHLGISDASERSMWTGLFNTAGHIGFCIMCPVWGALADRYGRRIMILRANFISALIIPLMLVAPGVIWLVALRFLLGMFSGTITACQTLVSSFTPKDKTGFALGALSSAVYGGSMLGGLIGGLVVDHFGFRVAFFTASAVLFMAGLLVLLGVRENFNRTIQETSGTGFRLKIPHLGSAGIILGLIAMMGFARQFDAPFLPLLVELVNGPERAATWTGTISSLAAVAGMVSGILLGALADRISAPRVAIFSALLAGLLMLPHGLATNLGMLMIARFGMVFCAGGLDPIFMIWLAKSTPEDQRGTIFGWAGSAKTLGWVASALLGTGIAMTAGVRNIFFVGSILFFALIPAIILSMRKQSPPALT